MDPALRLGTHPGALTLWLGKSYPPARPLRTAAAKRAGAFYPCPGTIGPLKRGGMPRRVQTGRDAARPDHPRARGALDRLSETEGASLTNLKD